MKPHVALGVVVAAFILGLLIENFSPATIWLLPHAYYFTSAAFLFIGGVAMILIFRKLWARSGVFQWVLVACFFAAGYLTLVPLFGDVTDRCQITGGEVQFRPSFRGVDLVCVSHQSSGYLYHPSQDARGF